MHRNRHHHHRVLFDGHHQSDYIFKPSSTTSVDCTLSLGTPSTRLSNNDISHQHYPKQPSANTHFSWGDHMLFNSQQQQQHASTYYSPYKPSATRTAASNASSDSLLARRCANCDTTSTPLWRNGPRGPKSLCNACGIRFKKEERRATAATTTTAPSNNVANIEVQRYNINPWPVQSQKPASLSPVITNQFKFIEDETVDNGIPIPILSWRLNVTDRPSLVHDFTR